MMDIIYCSADERFDGTYQTNIVVSSDGSMLYVPPGIFKSTCKVATLILLRALDTWGYSCKVTYRSPTI